jgi:hypothetical protein
MKTSCLATIFFMTIFLSSYGQNNNDLNKGFAYGIKAASLFNSSDDISNALDEVDSADSAKENASGYTIGLYVKVKIFMLYLRPEIQYTNYNTNYANISVGKKRLELPVSVGLPLTSYLSAFAGPTFRFNIDQEISEFNLEAAKKESTVGIHLGIRLNFKKLGIDIRYDRGITKEETLLLSNNDVNIGTIDQRPNLLSIGLSYVLSKSHKRK